MDQYYGTYKVAKILNISPTTLYNWEKSGKLVPQLKVPGGKKYYSLKQIEYCLQNGMHKNQKMLNQLQEE